MANLNPINNQSPNTTFVTLEQIDTKNVSLDLSTSALSLYGYEALKKKLEAARAIRLLLCKTQYRDDITGTAGEQFKTLELVQSNLAKALHDLLSSKAEIRCMPVDSPTAAMTCVHGTDEIGIMPGPDYTLDGLGVISSLRPYQAFPFEGAQAAPFSAMFEGYWNGAVDVKDDFLHTLTDIYRTRSPKEIYEFALAHLFSHDELEYFDPKTGITNTKIYNSLYQFQRDAMISAIEKIEKYNGCILCDSVGLGKTFTALAVIKYYELKNLRVLVLAPKKLRDNWIGPTTNAIDNPLSADRFGYTVLNHTDLTRQSGRSGDVDLATVNLENYDLIVIDESHNFKTDSSEKTSLTRYKRLLDAVQSGVKTKILMLTATPVNTKLKDLQSQINFITEKHDDALAIAHIDSISRVIKDSQKDFNEWMERPDEERTLESFFQAMTPEYFKLLETLTIARSRKLIEHFYDTTEIGRFPTRRAPINITPASLIAGDTQATVQSIADQLYALQLAIYAPLNYVRPESREKYKDYFNEDSSFNDVGRERTTIKLLRSNLLKRLESHIHSFILSLERLIELIDKTCQRIEQYLDSHQGAIPIHDISGGCIFSVDDDGEDDDIPLTPKYDIAYEDYDLDRWLSDLRLDLNVLTGIRDSLPSANISENDCKLAELIRLIEDKWAHPINANNPKVLIFTAFSDTARELYDTLAPKFWAEHHIYTGLVTGSGVATNLDVDKTVCAKLNLKKFNSILTHFSPRSKGRNIILQNKPNPIDNPEMIPEIDVLIATDCVSEGQNLQDCDICINYDIHWNPIRITQRFGRIDRLGSQNAEIQLVNFWPTQDLDAYLNLSKRVKGREELMDHSGATDGSVIKPSNRRIQSDRDFDYRARQLGKLREHVENPEDISDSIPLTDINLSQWRTEAMHLLGQANRRDVFLKTPHGIYAVAPATSQIPAGTTLYIFKCDQPGPTPSLLAPYYPVLVAPDGAVRVSWIAPFKILTILRDTCANVSQSAQAMSRAELDKCAKQLRLALAELRAKDEASAAESLFNTGGTSIGISQSDYELLCFIHYKSQEA